MGRSPDLMRKSVGPTVKVGCALICAVMLGAWMRGVRVEVSGSPAAPLFESRSVRAFGVFPAPRPAITRVTVQDHTSEGSPVVWSITRSESCEASGPFQYGVTPPPYREGTKAQPLQAGAVYSVTLSGCGFVGGAYFRIADGRLIFVNGTGTGPHQRITSMGVSG